MFSVLWAKNNTYRWFYSFQSEESEIFDALNVSCETDAPQILTCSK